MKNEFITISFLIKDNSRVLDVGCGDGELMKFLAKQKTKDIRGLEISKKNVQDCISKGLTVIEGDAEYDLKQFPNQSFDYVILNQTLQAFLNPENVINELLRVGKRAIVTIPNIGYWRVRLKLLITGKMPVTKNLPNEWYDTPNLHMCTIKDFFDFCVDRKIKISDALAIKNQKNIDIYKNSKITKVNLEYQNLISELGIFLIKK